VPDAAVMASKCRIGMCQDGLTSSVLPAYYVLYRLYYCCTRFVLINMLYFYLSRENKTVNNNNNGSRIILAVNVVPCHLRRLTQT
jgi:hypothetical protein